MTILASGITQVRSNARLLAAVGLDAERIIAQMNQTNNLFGASLACSEAARDIRSEAEIVAQDAAEELGDSDREIARMLRILVRNLHMIRYGGAVETVR